MFGRKKQQSLQKQVCEMNVKMDKLMIYVPKLYNLLVNARPSSTYPCKEIQQQICAKCAVRSCMYHSETTLHITAEEIMNDFIKLVDSQK